MHPVLTGHHYFYLPLYAGISWRSQELFFVVFLARFFGTCIFRDQSVTLSLIYLTGVEIGISSYIVHFIRNHEHVRSSYSRTHDVFPHRRYAVAPCFAISLLMFAFDGDNWKGFPLFFSFSLEVVAILPQLMLLQHSGECDDVTGLFVFFLGARKPLHVLGFLYLVQEGDYSIRTRELSMGPSNLFVIQVMVYFIFFVYIFKSNATLQRKKDDSQTSALAELDEPLTLMETLTPPTL
jgi:ER lumen protein retaining receptor